MRGRLLLAHRPGRSLRLPRDRRGERPRTTASPLGAVGTILGPGWGHAIRPITAGRAIGGGDRRRARAGALTLGAAGIGWVFASPVRAGALAMLLSADTMWSRPRAQRRTLGSPGVLRQLEQKLHWSAENAHARVGDRYQNRQADSRGSRRTHTTKPPFAETRFRQAIADGLAGEQAAAGATAASKNRITHEHRPLTAKTGVRVP